MRSVEVMVIGGGASGMMAAITAAEAGAHVVLIEKLNRVGKKILATGNGRCNFTNLKQKADCYHSRTTDFPWQVVSAFDEKKVMEWFRERGILSMERDGYIYPRSAQAASVVQILQRMLAEVKVQIHTEESLRDLRPRQDLQGNRNGYEVITSVSRYLADQVILAPGGAAAPVHGTSGDGYEWMKRLGIQVVEPLPALSSLILEDACCKIWPGVRIQGQVSVYSDSGMCLGSDRGEIQMVQYGISGIPVFQISYLVARELAEGKKPYLILDSMCEFTKDALMTELSRRLSTYDHLTLSVADILEGMLPEKLVTAYIRAAGLKNSTRAEDVKRKQWECLADQMKAKKLEIHDVSGFDKAQVTSGGVSLEMLDVDSMELRKYPGLYIVGEFADVDGICGGYNLQWAWSSGHMAGMAAAAKANERRRIRGQKRGTR